MSSATRRELRFMDTAVRPQLVVVAVIGSQIWLQVDAGQERPLTIAEARELASIFTESVRTALRAAEYKR